MVWLDRDPFALLRASTGLDGMFRVAEGLTGALTAPFSAPRGAANRPAPHADAARTHLEVDGTAAHLTSLVPGFGPDDLDLSVQDRSVRVAGSREGRSFERAFRLPYAVQTDGVEASVEDGVLRLALPRRAEDRPTAIPVAGATRPAATIEANGAEAAPTSEVTTAPSSDEVAPTPTLPRLRPTTRVRRTDAGLELTIVLPGAVRDSIELGTEDGDLHLKANTSFAAPSGGRSTVFREFRLGAGYDGRWALPEDVDPDGATSRYEHGELVVTLPLRAQTRRSIDVS